MNTMEELNAQLRQQPVTSDVYKVLYLAVLINGIDIAPDVAYDDVTKTVTMAGNSYPCAGVAFQCPFTASGYIYPTKKKNQPYAPSCFPSIITHILKDALNITYRHVHKAFTFARPASHIATGAVFDTFDWVPATIGTLLCDADIARRLANVAVYTESGPHHPYPFIPVYFDGANITAHYPIYRYVGGLPYERMLSDVWALPIIDHICRNPSDSRRVSLRYCTKSQNSRNYCKRTGRFHGTTKANTCQVAAKTLDEKGSLFYIRTWCSLITLGAMDSYPILQDPYEYLSLDACHSSKLAGISPAHQSFLDRFTKEMVAVLTTRTEFKAAYTHADLIGHLRPDLKLLNSLVDPASHGEIKPKGACCTDYVVAICNDIYKIHNHKEWSHLNLTKTPPPVHTLASLAVQTPNWDPVDVLNAFEDLYDPSFMDTYLSEQGFAIDMIADKKRVFVWKPNADGKLVIVGSFVDRTVPATVSPVVLKELDSEFVTHPWTKMLRNNVADAAAADDE